LTQKQGEYFRSIQSRSNLQGNGVFNYPKVFETIPAGVSEFRGRSMRMEIDREYIVLNMDM
jgi:hypothetical protein